jgi:hypothetical protein
MSEIEIRPVAYRANGEVEWVPASEATAYGVYVGEPGAFEWRADFPTVPEAAAYARTLSAETGAPVVFRD